MRFQKTGIVKTVEPSTFEWIVPSLECTCYHNENKWIWSPLLHQGDLRFTLDLYFNTSQEWMDIFTCRIDGGEPKVITITIKMKDRTDVAEITRTVCLAGPISGFYKEFLKNKVTFNSIFQHSFTVICGITCDTSYPAAEKEFVACASQTEVAKSVSEKENPEDEDRSSLDRKGVELLSDRMKDLLIKGVEHDVTICVQDKEFRAHRSILSARSPVFAMMLSHDTKENNTGVINIKDCEPESFDEFLLYVYSGKTKNLTPSNAHQLYYTADKYDFPVLKELCVSHLKSSLSVDSICDVVILAAKHQEKELLEVATEFFARNIKKILVTVGWQNFMYQNPVEANELYIKSMEILHPEN